MYQPNGESKVWWISYYREGRRYYENSHSKKKKEAAALLKVREGDIVQGKPITPALARLTFGQAATDVVADYPTNGKKSLPNLERRIRLHLLPYFGNRRMVSITTADVRAYTAARQDEGAANATINRELAILKRTYRLAVQAGKLLHRPHIPMLSEDNVRQGFLERDEFEVVRTALSEDLRGIVTFAYLTGWRVPSEILSLQWHQVDRKAKTVRLEVGTTKNKAGRLVPYDVLPELEDVIETQWRARLSVAGRGIISPWVFHRGGRLIKDLRGAWTKACKSAGLPGRLLHDFRRTAVRNLDRAGVPRSVAMQITGHKTESVYRRYSIVAEADLRDGLGKLASATGTVWGQSSQNGRVHEMDNPS